MIGKDEEVELPELDKILTKYMTGESKRPLWPYLTEALQKCLIPLRRRRDLVIKKDLLDKNIGAYKSIIKYDKAKGIAASVPSDLGINSITTS